MAYVYEVIVIVTTLIIFASCATYSDPCHFHMSVNITGGLQLSNGILFDDLLYPPSYQFTYTDDSGVQHIRGCLCDLKPCIRKCCPIGKAYSDGQCVNSSDSLVNPFNPPIYRETNPMMNISSQNHFGIVFGNPCEKERYVLNPYTVPPSHEDLFYLQENGFIYVPNSSGSNHTQMNYCLEAWLTDPFASDDDWKTHILPLVCFGDEPVMSTLDYSMFLIFAIGMIISIPFLVVTFLVYAFVPELQNIHGKSLMCYVFGLIVAYVSLSTIQIKSSRNNVIPSSECFGFAFTIYLSFMISFFWLNTMCFDLWWTFRGFRVVPGGKRAAERRRFFYYCLYAFGFPVALTGVCAAMQFHPNLPEHIVKPNIGVSGCWFHDWLSGFVYFYTPVIILVISNIVLFASTTYTIHQIKKDTSILVTGDNSASARYARNEQRFHLYLKLFVVMGINWTVECISFSIGGSFLLWIITDIGNILLGIIIFFVFVWKPKVKKMVMSRYSELRYGVTTYDINRYPNSRSSNSARTISTDRSHVYNPTNSVRLSELNRITRQSERM